MKYRKKPVVIEAYQTDKELDIETLEGTMHASVGDYIITGVRGEQYPCKPDIFEQTYEPADAPAASPWHRVEKELPEEDRKMTGYECLKEELYKLGCNKSQVEAKVVPLVLGVVAGDPEKFIKIAEWESEIEKKKYELKRREEAVEEDERTASLLIDKASKIAKKTQDYVDAFYYAIQSGETPEGRDALRKAQMFVNSVTVETKYDNTAFIAGLAAILSEGKVAPMDELQKINPKIPDIKANGKIIYPDGGLGYTY